MSTGSYSIPPPHADFQLVVRQQPKQGRMAIGKEKDRKPLDPPPIVQLVSNRRDGVKNYLQSPYLILTARLVKAHGKDDSPSSPEDQAPSSALSQSHNSYPEPKENDLVGTVVSSLYSLKDTDNTQGGFFVFGDLSVRKEGTYRLEFILYELKLQDKECWLITRTTSDPFIVYAHKLFPGIEESTFLTRSFSDQGVRLRLRKDSRAISSRKRNSSVANQMDHYRQQQAQAHQQHQQHHQYAALPENGTPDLSPNGHSHLRRTGSMHDPSLGGHLDRSRQSMNQGGSYFNDTSQLRGEYNSGSYNYGYEDGRSGKRMRMDESPTTYDNDPYPQYAQAGPRTVPDHMGGAPLYPITSSYPVPVSQPALSNLPMPPMTSMMPTPPMPGNPSPFSSIPRIDTQLHHHSNLSPH